MQQISAELGSLSQQTPSISHFLWARNWHGLLTCVLVLSMSQFSSVAQSCPTLCDSMDCNMPGLPIHYQLLELAQLMAISQWCHPTISSSVIPFTSRLQSFPGLGSFQISQLFASDGQSIGVSASALVLSMNIQGWFPLGLTGLISLQSKGLSRVFTTSVQNHQFFDTQTSLWSNSHICTWLLEKP